VTVGVRSMVAPLRRVLVRQPATSGDFAAAGWRVPDTAALARQHDAFCGLLATLGCDVIVAAALPGLVDACFVYDSAFVIGDGAIILRCAKPARRDEPQPAEQALRDADCPIIARLDGDAYCDGGDLFWLDPDTLIAGRGYRTNAVAHRQLDQILAPRGVRLERVDLPHDHGPAHVLHTMSFISPVTDTLAVVFEPLMPVPLVELLAERGGDGLQGRLVFPIVAGALIVR
jgi:dimethylargininase